MASPAVGTGDGTVLRLVPAAAAKKATRRLIQLDKALRSRPARRAIPQALRDDLAAATEGLEADLRALRAVVRCPDDAPPGQGATSRNGCAHPLDGRLSGN
jgi:hypothetical protein